MKSVVARLFRHQLSEILDTHPPPSNPLPHQTPNPLPQPLIRPWITRTEISGSTMYSNLVWIMCCSLGFLKWYRSLYQTSALGPPPRWSPREVEVWGGPRGWDVWPPPQSQRKTCIPFFSSHVIFRKHVLFWGRGGEGGREGGRGVFFIMVTNKVLIIVDMILSWKILWFQRVSEHVLELRALRDKKSQRYALLILIVWQKKKKRHILYILSFRCSWKYTCTVYFLLLIDSHAL